MASMIFDNIYIFFLCAIGVFNCFLASIYFLFLQREYQLKNSLFGLLTLLLSVRVGKTVFMSFSGTESLLVAQVGLSACFLIGVALYYYLKATLQNREQLPASWLLHVGGLLCIVLGVGLWKPYASHPLFWDQFFALFIYAVWGGYLVAGAYALRIQLLGFLGPRRQRNTLHTWLVLVWLGNVLIFLAYVIGYLWLLLVEMLTFSVVFYVLTFYFLSARDRNLIFRKTPEKYARKKIEPAEAKRLKERLALLMQSEQLYKNPNLKMEDLSSRLKISQHRLSQLLNDNLGESFTSYVNRHRVENAIFLLQNNDVFTVEAIGYQAGFISKSGFYATFKKLTGTTPAHYRKKSD